MYLILIPNEGSSVVLNFCEWLLLRSMHWSLHLYIGGKNILIDVALLVFWDSASQYIPEYLGSHHVAS